AWVSDTGKRGAGSTRPARRGRIDAPAFFRRDFSGRSLVRRQAGDDASRFGARPGASTVALVVSAASPEANGQNAHQSFPAAPDSLNFCSRHARWIWFVRGDVGGSRAHPGTY